MCYLSRACSFFFFSIFFLYSSSHLFLIHTVISPYLSIRLFSSPFLSSFFLFGSSFPSSTWTCLLVTSSTFSRLHSLSCRCHRRCRRRCPPQSLSILSPLCLLISVHPSISVRQIWCCVIVSASPLGWRLSKGPQDPHTPRVSSHARDALSLLSSSSLSSHPYQFIWPLSSSRRDGGKVTSPASLPVHSYNQSAHFAEHPLKIFQIVHI